ncbi:MAG: pantoate--beta-alanine ligase [Oligoflexia bacterium]|nr:pantoate--beta-alanine ligase [Oligoflexia bacterium]
MHIMADPHAVQLDALKRRARAESIGFVPTMGFLHSGHRSLMDLVRPRCDHLVVSIYVNPLQFCPGEDLDEYPRDPEGDAELCSGAGVDLLFMPETLYEPGHASTVSVSGLTDGLCGARRPGHFDGVTTVVSRLFGLVQPTLAVFGEKDYQQLAVIRRMTRDLALPVEIIGAPLVRDTDGLALSSRNKYLSADQRIQAQSLSQTLFAIQAAVAAGNRDVRALLALGRTSLNVDRIDYLEIVDPDSLQPMDRVDRPARALVAAFVGQTRLIDNVALCPA